MREYKVPASFTLTAAGGNTDIFQLNAATNKPIRLAGFRLGNTTEVGDTAEEGIEFQLMHMTATVTDGGGTGSTLVTPVVVVRGGAAAGFTARVNSPTVATTSGTTTIEEYVGWINRQTPFEFWYPDTKWCLDAIAGETIILRMNTTLLDDMTLNLTLFVEEEG